MTYSSAGNLNVDPRIPETPPLTSVQRTIPPDRAAALWADAGTWEGLPGKPGRGRAPPGYTGQVWLPEIGLWHYKARMYNPQQGRFLQTDPVGYEDQMNLYAYVGNDPVGRVDPTGQFAFLAAALPYVPAAIAAAEAAIVVVSAAVVATAAQMGIDAYANESGTEITAPDMASDTGGDTGSQGADTAAAPPRTDGSGSGARSGGGKTGRKVSKDALQQGRQRVADALKTRDGLRSKPNKTKAIKQQLKTAEKALKKARDQLRASENHAQRSQRPNRRN